RSANNQRAGADLGQVTANVDTRIELNLAKQAVPMIGCTDQFSPLRNLLVRKLSKKSRTESIQQDESGKRDGIGTNKLLPNIKLELKPGLRSIHQWGQQHQAADVNLSFGRNCRRHRSTLRISEQVERFETIGRGGRHHLTRKSGKGQDPAVSLRMARARIVN